MASFFERSSTPTTLKIADKYNSNVGKAYIAQVTALAAGKEARQCPPTPTFKRKHSGSLIGKALGWYTDNSKPDHKETNRDASMDKGLSKFTLPTEFFLQNIEDHHSYTNKYGESDYDTNSSEESVSLLGDDYDRSTSEEYTTPKSNMCGQSRCSNLDQAALDCLRAVAEILAQENSTATAA
jgi:hypothetical protein